MHQTLTKNQKNKNKKFASDFLDQNLIFENKNNLSTSKYTILLLKYYFKNIFKTKKIIKFFRHLFNTVPVSFIIPNNPKYFNVDLKTKNLIQNDLFAKKEKLQNEKFSLQILDNKKQKANIVDINSTGYLEITYNNKNFINKKSDFFIVTKLFAKNKFDNQIIELINADG